MIHITSKDEIHTFVDTKPESGQVVLLFPGIEPIYLTAAAAEDFCESLEGAVSYVRRMNKVN